jgi:hypothetical protein
MYNNMDNVSTHSNAACIILLFAMTTEMGAIPFKISSSVATKIITATTT